MARVFVDSSAWLAVADRREGRHTATRQAYTALLEGGAELVTTDLVLAETHVLLRRRLSHQAAMQFLESTNASPRIDVVFTTPDLERAAKQLLEQYDDQAFSLTDAISFVVMRQHGIDRALTLDAHFTTAGFIVTPVTIG